MSIFTFENLALLGVAALFGDVLLDDLERIRVALQVAQVARLVVVQDDHLLRVERVLFPALLHALLLLLRLLLLLLLHAAAHYLNAHALLLLLRLRTKGTLLRFLVVVVVVVVGKNGWWQGESGGGGNRWHRRGGGLGGSHVQVEVVLGLLARDEVAHGELARGQALLDELVATVEMHRVLDVLEIEVGEGPTVEQDDEHVGGQVEELALELERVDELTRTGGGAAHRARGHLLHRGAERRRSLIQLRREGRARARRR